MYVAFSCSTPIKKPLLPYSRRSARTCRCDQKPQSRYVYLPTATLDDPKPTIQPELSSEMDDSVTVAAYVNQEHNGIAKSSQKPIDALVENLDHHDRFHPTRSRADVIHTSHNRTKTVHSGERVLGVRKTKAVLDAIHVPVVQSATYTFRSTQDIIDYKSGSYTSYQYGRYGNPTVRAVEEKIMALEEAEACILSSSGMNSVTTMMMALVPEGGHVVTTTDCYRRTRQFVSTMLPRMGISYSVLDPSDLEGFRTLLESRKVTLYFSELPTNPLMRVVDVPEIVSLCRKHGVISVLDTTFATPINFRPIAWGVDLVLHSVTKYLAGHQDVMCGAIAGPADMIEVIRQLHFVLGGVVDPHSAYLVNRGIRTLALRMEAHNRNAEAVTCFLSTHPKIAQVHHPTLKAHPDHQIAAKLFDKGFGGMLSFELKGDGNPWSRRTFKAAGDFIDHLTIPYIGPSLGGCESLVEQVTLLSYYDKTLRERRDLGIRNGLVRFSCGIESLNDLINDIEQALDYV